jgi:hypothetical protein
MILPAFQLPLPDLRFHKDPSNTADEGTHETDLRFKRSERGDQSGRKGPQDDDCPRLPCPEKALNDAHAAPCESGCLLSNF